MRRRDLLARSASVVTASLALTTGVPLLAHAADATGVGGTGGAAGLSLQTLQAHMDEEGVYLDYDIQVNLSEDLKDALQRGISVVFVAEALLFERRWYWTDRQRAQAVRRWRITYQPLTRQWRVSIGAFTRQHASLEEALGTLRRSTRWRLGDRPEGDPGDHYVDFGFRLDTKELPRPLQIGMGGRDTWDLELERQVRFQP